MLRTSFTNAVDGAEVIVGSSGSSFKKAAKDAIKKVKAAS